MEEMCSFIDGIRFVFKACWVMDFRVNLIFVIVLMLLKYEIEIGWSKMYFINLNVI